MIFAGFKSDRGKRRQNNEDSCFVMPKEQVYIVADGVGGENGGETASSLAVSSIAQCVKEKKLHKMKDQEEICFTIKECVEFANRKIINYAQKHEENIGMATTLVLCCIKDDKAYFANAGDSRAYIFRGGELFQITEDHSVVSTLLKKGAISQEEAARHENKNMITKALGAENQVNADYYQTDIKPGDVVLLCTDGLYNEVPEDEIKMAIKEIDNMNNLAEILIKMANYHGGGDNVTAVCLKVEGGDFQ